MNSIAFAVASLKRDWRSGELTVLVAALLVAVTALSAVGFFTNRIGQAVDQQAAEVLAADLIIRSSEPISDEYVVAAEQSGLQTARVLRFPSVVYNNEQSALGAITAVNEGYPLRGKVRVSVEAFGEPVVTDETPLHGEIWADHRLLARIGADVGDTLKIGASHLSVSKALDYRPDQGWDFIDVAPSLLMHLDDIPATELVQPGSRVTHKLLLAGSEADIAAFRANIETRLTETENIRDLEDSSPQIRSAIDRARRFLGLSAMVSVLLACVAVAMAARRYSERHTDTVALMKCMGADQAFVLRVMLVQLLVLALVTGALGNLFGFAAQHGLAYLADDFIKGELPPPEPGAAILGFATAAAILIGFALAPVLRLKHVPPLRVLRRDLEAPPLRHLVVAVLAVGAVLAMLYWLIRDLKLVLYVAGGMTVMFLVMAAVGFGLVRALQPLRGQVGVAWRYGLANIARRGRESVVQLVAFGTGLMVLLLLTFVRSDLLDDWRDTLPDRFPNNFLINIQPDETDAVTQFFAEQDLEPPRLVPLIRARMTMINGVSTDDVVFPEPQGKRFAQREQNLTWSNALQEDNKILEGQWWNEENDTPQVSVETEFAKSLGLSLGDRLEFDVAGERLVAQVSSLREVQWDSFRPNFFMVFSPGTFDNALGTYVTSLYVDPNERTVFRDLVNRFPSVSVIDMEAILTQVREVMAKASFAVQYVFLFTMFAGITVLLAAVQTTRDERRYESAMLRTLGARRQVVFAGVVAEFTTLGLLAGTLGSLGATVLGYVLATQLFDLEFSLNPLLWFSGLLAGTLLVGIAGTIATRSVVDQSPVITLRENF